MRSLGVLPLVGALLVGCGLFRAVPAPTPPAPAGSGTPSAAPALETRSREAPAPAKESPPPTVPVTKDLSPPAPELTATMSEADETRLTKETQERIHSADQLVGQIGLERLTGAQRETLSTVRSFIAKARLALTSKDLKEAANLAEKARVLAAELLRATR